jgi:molybdopterin/thiamine biosynthesis adenylyltransferase/proteasome lid subunit RPN8/RPN11
MPIVELTRAAFQVLLTIIRDAVQRGTETHAYLLGRRSLQEIIITTVLRAGTPVEHAAMTQPDYAAAALAMQPHLARGEVLLGEVHRHPTGYRGPSPGDRRMLLSIPPEKYPGYLCMVATDIPDDLPFITAHSVKDGEIVEHEVRVIDNAYPVLLPDSVGDVKIFAPGAGSGAPPVDLQLAKLPIAELLIADFDVFEERNLHRHIATPDAIGEPKAPYLAAFLQARSHARISALDLRITPENIDDVDRLVSDYTFTANLTGDPGPSILLSRSCARAGKVCIHAGAFPRAAGGFVFLQTPDGPCYECLYDLQRDQASEDPKTLEALTKQYGYTEEELQAHVGLWCDVNVVASLVAKIALEFLKHGQLKDNLWVIDNDRLTITSRRVQRHAECTTCQPTEDGND